MHKFSALNTGGALQRINAAVQGLLIDQPHMVIPLLRLEKIQSDKVDLMGVDGAHLYYNESAVCLLTPGELRFVLCHESCHLLGMHHFRQSGRDLEQWNVATDININSQLVTMAEKQGSGLSVPAGLLSDSTQVNDKGAPLAPETIYANRAPDPEQPGDEPEPGDGDSDNDESTDDAGPGESGDDDSETGESNSDGSGDDSSETEPDTNTQNDESENSDTDCPAESNPPDGPENGSDSDSGQNDSNEQDSDQTPVESEQTGSYGGCGAIMPADSESNPENTPEQWAQTVAQSVAVAKSQGLETGEMTALYGDFFSPRTNWRQKMSRYFSGVAKDDYSWAKPNRKYLGLGLVSPGLKSTGCGVWILALDVSGSMTGEIPKCLAHINRIFATVRPEKVYVVYVDSSIKLVDVFTRDQKITLRQFVAGGTDFRPLFNWVTDQKIRPEGMVFFTDCYGAWPDKKPRYPVVIGTTEAIDTLPASCKPPAGVKTVEIVG